MKRSLFLLTFLFSSAFAQFHSFPMPAKIIPLTAVGSGGTTHGDKDAACMRAEERAADDVEMSCYNRDGELTDLRLSACDCRKKSGSKDDYNCEVTAFARCLVRPHLPTLQKIVGLGAGGTSNGDKMSACEKAEARAMTEAETQCFQAGGQSAGLSFTPCDCRKVSGSKDDYRCEIKALLDCRMNFGWGF